MIEAKKHLTGNTIKLIAIVAMTIDHLTYLFFPGRQSLWYVVILHIIGRLTAPIMWFFISEGCHYTRNIKKYAGRLFIFAVISHFAYNFAFGLSLVPFKDGFLNQTSVMWSLAWAVVLIALCEQDKLPRLKRNYENKTEIQLKKTESNRFWIKMLIIVCVCVLTLPSDWSCIAVMCPFFLYTHRGNFKKQAGDIALWSAIYAAVTFLVIDKIYGLVQICTCLSIPVLMQYNGQRGKIKSLGKVFYIYYPLHLAIIGILRIIMYGNISIL